MEKPIACVMGSLSIVRPLGMAGIPVVAVTKPGADEHAALSRYVKQTVHVPKTVADPGGVVSALMRFASTAGARPVLFFDDDEDTLLISRNRERLETRFRFALPPPELLEDLIDKKRFAALGQRLGLPVPETLVVTGGSAAQSDRLRTWDRFPCIVKPGLRTNWFGSRLANQLIGATQKAVRVESRGQLDALVPELAAHGSDFIVQPLIEGGEDLIVSYHAYARDGLAVADFTGRKVRTTPRAYGFSTYVQITDDAELCALGRSVVDKLGFSGVVKLDFKQDVRTGRLYLLEANPRFNLWHHAGAVAGVNLPLLVYCDLVAQGSVHAGVCRARPNVRWMSAALDLSAFSQHRAAGELSRLRWVRQLLSAHVVEDLCWRDPLPGLARLAAKARRRMTGATALRAQ
jgi:D-aspartate ligase